MYFSPDDPTYPLLFAYFNKSHETPASELLESLSKNRKPVLARGTSICKERSPGSSERNEFLSLPGQMDYSIPSAVLVSPRQKKRQIFSRSVGQRKREPRLSSVLARKRGAARVSRAAAALKSGIILLQPPPTHYTPAVRRANVPFPVHTGDNVLGKPVDR